MKVILDARPLQSASGGRGIGRYVRELARHLPGTGGVDQVLLLLDGRRRAPLDLPDGNGLKPLTLRRLPGPAVLMDRLLRFREIEESGAEIFHATYLAPPQHLPDRMATVMTVHDLNPLLVPGSVPPRAATVFRMAFKGAPGCGRVVVPSHATARAVQGNLGVPRERIVVTHLGVDAASFGTEDTGATPPAEGRYLLHVGGFDPTKNLGLLLDLMERLGAVPSCADLRLVVVGEGGKRGKAFARQADSRGLRDRILLPGRLDDGALAAAYAGAELFLFPSTSEGFGLPALEAQAAGCPVLAADASSLPEVVGDAGRLLPPDDPEAWSRSVQEVLERSEVRREMSETGRRRAAQFTWAATAEATARAYREAHEAA